ncbi:TetR/AcrR family transcriptional regulator [Mucilaginibacter gracilis]|uniref:TetR/AcrR family transcriptional regulator n=1 Tax=Mucilaginibacter gracilis TaxID=423350 RepID=UPI0013C2B751|nr:TetR/AcrR family transcriptional regulator [Mucilaginibacter gracilis]
MKDIKLIDTEAQIKAAAKTVFLKRGLAGARMQEIAQVAGIGRTTLNYYYRSKDKLFQVIWKEAFRSIAVRTEVLRNNNYSTLEKMDAFVDGYFDHALVEPELDLFMLNEFNNNPDMMKDILMTETNDNPFHILLHGIEKAVKNGEMKGAPEQILITVISMCLFSFAGGAVIQNLLSLNNEQYMELMKERKVHLKTFLKTAFTADFF